MVLAHRFRPPVDLGLYAYYKIMGTCIKRAIEENNAHGCHDARIAALDGTGRHLLSNARRVPCPTPPLMFVFPNHWNHLFLPASIVNADLQNTLFFCLVRLGRTLSDCRRQLPVDAQPREAPTSGHSIPHAHKVRSSIERSLEQPWRGSPCIF